MVDVLTTFDSALGVFDGRVYETLWKRAQMEPMNKDEVTPAYAVSLCSLFGSHILSRRSLISAPCYNVGKLRLSRR
jgi:hypothetical protein